MKSKSKLYTSKTREENKVALKTLIKNYLANAGKINENINIDLEEIFIVVMTIDDMVQKGVHLGHQTARWNPKMAPYIYTKRNGVHIIDLIQTCSQLKTVSKMLEEYSSQGKSFLFVGTKRQASGLLAKIATECNSFYVNQRWLGGMLTNWKTIKRSLRTLQELEGKEGTEGFQKLPKKEASTFRKRKERLQKYLGGLKGMQTLPDVVIIVGQVEEMNAVLECKKLGITTVTILDTDCDPTLTDLFVAANDDSIKSLTLLCNTFLHAIQTGRDRLKDSNIGTTSGRGKANRTAFKSR